MTPAYALLAAMTSGALSAASGGGESSTSVDLSTVLNVAQYGLLGVFVVLLLTKKFIVPTYMLSELKERYEQELTNKEEVVADLKSDLSALKEANLELQNLTRDKLIPALVQATSATQAYAAELARRGSIGDWV